MTNEEAYLRLLEHGVSRAGALRLLTYAYQARLLGGWDRLLINDGSVGLGGSEGQKARAMEVFREAGVDPIAITFPEKLTGKPPFGMS